MSGLVDAEGSFWVFVSKNSNSRIGWQVTPGFSITLHELDLHLLEMVQDYFGGIGYIRRHGPNTYSYRVQSKSELNIIIDFFDKYGLISEKLADYLLFKMAFELYNKKAHLTIDGFKSILSIKASLNLGLNEQTKAAFPIIKPIARPLVINKVVPHPQWMAGFATGDGSFLVQITPSPKYKLKYKVSLVFQLTEHMRDTELLKTYIQYFGCGNIRVRSTQNAVDYRCNSFEDINSKIIPFFCVNQPLGLKNEDFKLFCKVAQLMENNSHLTPEGLSQIRKIKSLMHRRVDG